MTLAGVVGLGLLVGLAQALHCAAMCGVFALAAAAGPRAWPGLLAYLAGKTATYALLGALAGSAGELLAARVEGLAPWLGLLVGGVLVLSGGAALVRARRVRAAPASMPVPAPVPVGAVAAGAPEPPRTRRGPSALAALRALLPPLPRGRSALERFAVGAATGLLPCGVLALALLAAAARADVVEALLFMTAFGLGTVPALAVVALLGRSALGRRLAGAWSSAGPLLLVAAGVLALLRAGSAGDGCPACLP